MDLGFKDKQVLVCAASRGLGFAIAETFAQEGASLLICSRSESNIQLAARDLRERYGVDVKGKAVDLADPSQTQSFVDWLNQEEASIDVLVNNIGGPPPSSAQDTQIEAWRKGFDQVFLSSCLLSQHLSKTMKQKGYGRILTISSLSVIEPIENLVVSTAMRSAVTAYHKTLATELAPFGVTVNMLMPGVIHTQRIEDLRKARAERLGTSLAEEMRKTEKEIPLGRLGRPDELASLLVFLASERASYITGANIPVDGGLKRSTW